MDLIQTRRFFHTFPEIDFEEVRTTKEIINILKTFDCKIFYGRNLYKDQGFTDDQDLLSKDLQNGMTGALAVIGKGPYIFMRVDIDGLPVTESEDGDHLPAKEGFRAEKNMHACGHDGHITLGLAMAEYFAQNNISAKILFQPAEEGVLGSAKMDLDFIMAETTCALGFHIGLGQPQGTIGVGSTNFVAAQKLDLIFHGRPAHACNSPQDGASAFTMAAAFAQMAAELINDSRGRKVLNIGQVHGGQADNIVMKTCRLGIDVRAVESYLVDEMLANIEKIAAGISQARDGSYEIIFKGRSESYHEEDFDLVDKISNALEEKNIKTTKLPDFGASEDVTRYLNYAKSNGSKALHLLLGAKLAGPHHSDKFDFDDSNLEFYFMTLKIVVKEMLEEVEIN